MSTNKEDILNFTCDCGYDFNNFMNYLKTKMIYKEYIIMLDTKKMTCPECGKKINFKSIGLYCRNQKIKKIIRNVKI